MTSDAAMNTNIFFISTLFYVTKSTDCNNQCSYRYQGLNNRIKLVVDSLINLTGNLSRDSTPAVSDGYRNLDVELLSCT